MSLIVNNTAIQTLFVNGEAIKKVQVRKSTDSTYTVVFEAAGDVYTGSFNYSELVNLYERFKSNGTPDGVITPIWNEYATGVCPLFQASYVVASQYDIGATNGLPANYAGVLDWENISWSNIESGQAGTINIFSPCCLEGYTLAELALTKRDNPIIANLQYLLFDCMTVYDFSAEEYILNPRYFGEPSISANVSDDYLTYTFTCGNGSVGSENVTTGMDTFPFVEGIKTFIDNVYFEVTANMLNNIRKFQPNTLLYENLSSISIPDNNTIIFNFSNPVYPDDLAVALSYLQPINPNSVSDIPQQFINGTISNFGEENGLFATNKYIFNSSDENAAEHIQLMKTTTNLSSSLESTPDIVNLYFLPESSGSAYYDENLFTASASGNYDIAIYNTKEVPISVNEINDTQYVYATRPNRVYYLTLQNSGYVTAYEDELNQYFEYVRYMNKKIGAANATNNLIAQNVIPQVLINNQTSGTVECFTRLSPYFLQGMNDDELQVIENVTPIDLGTAELNNTYPLKVTEIVRSDVTAYQKIAEAIQAVLSPATYPTSETFTEVSINNVGNCFEMDSDYYSDTAGTKLHIASYLFESKESMPDRLLMANCYGFLVNSDNSLNNIQKGDYVLP